MQVESCILSGKNMELVPLHVSHAADLAREADLESFRYLTTVPEDLSTPAFEHLIAKLLHRSQAVYFAMLFKGVAVGMTAYIDIRAEHRGLEIGSTWISAPYRGTRVNPEAKYLLLHHAFEELGALRVQLKTDGRNLHSQRAIEKLGVVKEGVLRQHLILPDGYIRDSVMYSLIPADWERVKHNLIQRLGYTPR